MTTREDAIRLAEEVGATKHDGLPSDWGRGDYIMPPSENEKLITLAQNEAYKRAAAVCESIHPSASSNPPILCAGRILALVKE
jgi:hypothetical protein